MAEQAAHAQGPGLIPSARKDANSFVVVSVEETPLFIYLFINYLSQPFVVNVTRYPEAIVFRTAAYITNYTFPMTKFYRNRNPYLTILTNPKEHVMPFN